MIRTLFATTALATLLAGAAYAQETTAPQPAPAAPMTDTAAPADAAVMRADGHLATNLIGETVYNGSGDNAENIGKVNDLVINATGNIEQVVVGVGGFLGIGEKNVALPYNEIKWSERDGDRWIVVSATKDQLQAQPDFDRRPYEPAVAAAPAAAPAATDTMAQAPATTTAPADTTAQAPAATDNTATAAIDRSTLKEMPAGEISADNLIGTNVYGSNDSNLGEISDVVLTQDGKVDAVIIDVGGFLGIGAKPVAVGMDKLAFMTDGNGNNYLYTTFTKEQLESATAYDKSSWAQNRDQQRLMMQ